MIPDPVRKYLRSRGTSRPWEVQGTSRENFHGAVVIPALAEEDALPETLKSLATNPRALLERFLVLVVVNNRAQAPVDLCRQNQRTLAWLRSAARSWPAGLHLAWVDAASLGRALPEKEGVGLARKIGFDLALERLDWRGEPLLVSLDADTLVQADYLESLVTHFRTHTAGGAVLPFVHRPAATSVAERAITLYELYLRHYVLGLRLAGSPYAYHSVGSALACRASAYVAAGGMNRRTAGEDFYFLQQLAKTSGVAPVCGTLVHPSPRISARTPFGTGPSVAALQQGRATTVRFYPVEAFDLLGDWLHLIRDQGDCRADELLAQAERMSAVLGDFLRRGGFEATWEKLCRQHGGSEQRLIQAFHQWFDALKTRQLLFAVCEKEGLWGGPEELLPKLLTRAGLTNAGDLGTYLAVLRKSQNVPAG
ncbi:Glycosyltransferase like family 2 [Geoalkalibacter ferrihydriticus]|nr:glycosyltransferase family 2 protein [Geoalkalibacter ferrihydriticus]SDM48170.1 Glycosyltransferase like family 2 [Geoalkalibacter ferrihydriticus]